MAIIEQINSPADIRKLTIQDLKKLAEEIRELIIKTTAKTGGHLAPSLGVVELTLALHYVFKTPTDRIIWDVGHQCYAHKIITGRRERFSTLRQYGGIAGFPKRSESEYDVFDTGHSGNSISVALGLVTGDRLRGDNRRTVAVIGDGSIVTGMALEALNHAGALKQDLIVVLNDNEMSIARSSGAIANYLNRIITGRIYNRLKEDAWQLLGHLPRDLSDRARLTARKLEEGLKNLMVPSLLFEELGFRYVGPINGHNIAELIQTFRRIEHLKGPILVHVVTRKGEGYLPAVRYPERFHATGPFDIATGEPLITASPTFTQHFGEKMVEIAKRDSRVVAITAGMCLGTGLAIFREKFPHRFFDVGICEQHAITFAAGLAQAGLRPVVAIYSTFLLRGLDQLLQDVCLQKLPVVFAIDRAGLVGEDGPTHHGAYDLSYLIMLPEMTVLAPRDEIDLKMMLEFAVDYKDGPVAIRYPRGGSGLTDSSSERAAVELGQGELLRDGKDGAVLAIGSGVATALAAAQLVAERGLQLAVADARFAKPIDEKLILRLTAIRNRLITIEENTLLGGFGNAVSLFLERMHLPCRLMRVGLQDRFIQHGPREVLLEEVGFTPEHLSQVFLDFFQIKG
ncbi:MAG: 1-deoxy-D-xylulose-5-phosphate synthase [candidate division WOR-3 bacterium]